MSTTSKQNNGKLEKMSLLELEKYYVVANLI